MCFTHFVNSHLACFYQSSTDIKARIDYMDSQVCIKNNIMLIHRLRHARYLLGFTVLLVLYFSLILKVGAVYFYFFN